uniref:Uncharacterized protein n=1 Tax=Helianthus annuus TaxID=4232 RepID=A0A251SXF5_HELAN
METRVQPTLKYSRSLTDGKPLPLTVRKRCRWQILLVGSNNLHFLPPCSRIATPLLLPTLH